MTCKLASVKKLRYKIYEITVYLIITLIHFREETQEAERERMIIRFDTIFRSIMHRFDAEREKERKSELPYNSTI